MEKKVVFEMSETLFPSLPGLEIEVRYCANAKITFDSEGRELEFLFSKFHVSIDMELWQPKKLPIETDGSDARKFLGRLRDAARMELYRQENPKPTLQEMFRPGKPERDFIE